MSGSDDPRPVLFHVLAAAGIVVGGVLGIREILDRPEVRLADERVSREGLESTVQVLATNESETTYCVEIRIGALDPEGLDLEDVPAEPQRGGGRLEPGQTVNFTGSFGGISEDEYEEELDEFVAYVDEQEPC